MKNKEYLNNSVKRFNKGYNSLRKKELNSNLVPHLLNINDIINSNNILNNEINIKDVLINMLNRTNNIYENFQLNLNNFKLDNDEYSKRCKIIRNIKDFISNNIFIKNNNSSDNIFCDVIYFFDLLIIKNKKRTLLSTFEKLGLGALLLVLKFNKLQGKILIKKYKSIFNDKYMTLEEINKIEILSLKLINYYIIQPNIINYINFLYKNIFINNKCKNIYNISKSIISILKNIMSFSNNYMKYHPFYLSIFIIKYCFEQNKADGFQKTLIDYFDMNMRIFRTTYEEFVNNNNQQLKISLIFEKQKEENKSLFKEKEIKNSDINRNLKKFERYKSTYKFNYNSSIYKSCKKEKKNKVNNSLVNLKINPIYNTYYKKFLDNYLSEGNNEFSECKHQIQKTLQISDTYDINNLKDNGQIKAESPKKCGILINYRYKKRIPEKLNNKLKLFNLKQIQEMKKNKNNEIIKEEGKKETKNNKNENNENFHTLEVARNNEYFHTIEIMQNNENNENKENINITNIGDKYKKLNSNLNNNSYSKHFYSIMQNYKNKHLNNTNINNKKNNNLISHTANKKINIKLLNNENLQKEKYKNNIMNPYLEKNNNNKILKSNYINNRYFNFQNIINENELSLSNNKGNTIDNKRDPKIHIRNFYKQKNPLNLNFSNFERKKLFLK